MSRAALLPTPGDPFLLKYWLDHYKKFWMDKVDQLYVYYNSYAEENIAGWSLENCESTPKTIYYYKPMQIQHGDLLWEMVNNAPEDLVMFIEDDAIIFKPQMIDNCFGYIEKGEADIVGSRRGSCPAIVNQRAAEKYNIDLTGYGDKGCAFWPNFFFAKKSDLLKTDGYFNAKSWEAGEGIDFLDIKFTERNDGDTFVWASLQLQELGLKVREVRQYHGSPDDLIHASQNTHLWDGQCPWFHIGSLSSGFNGVLKHKDGRPLGLPNYPTEPANWKLPNKPNTTAEIWEWERRVQWWLTYWQYCKGIKMPVELEILHGEYYDAILRIIDEFKLDLKNINRRIAAYKRLYVL